MAAISRYLHHGQVTACVGIPPALSAACAKSCWWTSSTSTKMERSTAAGTMLRD